MNGFPGRSLIPTNSPPSGGIDFERIWKEAKLRWLRPTEIYDILTHSSYFQIYKEPLTLPPSGTLVLFDRKLLRNFRRDGHPWRKKKDNKTVKEAHEHLKVGSEEKIHVYYAHGEGQSNLQRRVYWLLDKSLEHIVLVHYLEVKEGVKSNIQPIFEVSPSQDVQQALYYFTDADSSQTLGSSAVPDSALQMDLSEFDPNKNNGFDTFSLEDLRSTGETGFGNAGEPQWTYHSTGFTGHQITSEVDADTKLRIAQDWENGSWMTNNTRQATHYQIPYYDISQVSTLENVPYFQVPTVIQVSVTQSNSISSSLNNDAKNESNGTEWQQNQDLTSEMQWVQSGDSAEKTNIESGIENSEVFRKLDSLERWMEKELPVNNTVSPLQDPIENKPSPVAISVDSYSYLDNPTPEENHHVVEGRTEVASQSLIPEEERTNIAWQSPISCPHIYFEIIDYSPNWSFLSENAKVLVTGRFNGNVDEFFKIKWYCMFGDVEVPAETIHFGVLRCSSPTLSVSGKISFCVTVGGSRACSNKKFFEIKTSPEVQKQKVDETTEHLLEDAFLQCRFTKLLLQDSQNSTDLTTEASTISRLEKFMSAMDEDWVAIENLIKQCSTDLNDVKEQLLQIFFKHTLINQHFALYGKSLLSFDKFGQTVLHLASALGYEWIIRIAIASNVSIDFRDKNGWSALHWAAHYGRERMVASLLAAGAKPGTVSDPTPGNPIGRTPAEIAASRGFTGLAGYLSEQALVSHLNVLTLEENEHDKNTAHQEAHRVVEYLRRSMSLQRSVKTEEDQRALEDSLSAIGQATTASSRIHAAFKEFFVRERLRAIEEVDEYGFSVEEQVAVQKIQKAFRKHREEKTKERAALQIQNRFRGWKNRKNFLSLRQNAIKIQAFYRMHRARKQYQQIIWSAGILEKALLRWRQRRKGLRGYQAESKFPAQENGNDDFLTIGRKQAGESLERSVIIVQSMVRSRLARQQYRRMRENFVQAQISSSAWISTMEGTN